MSSSAFEETAMNDQAGGSGDRRRRGRGGGPRRAGAMAMVAAVAVLTAACGVVHVNAGSSGNSASTGSATLRANLAYAHCMQTHGVPSFPDPGSSQGFSISGQPPQNGQGTSPTARANNA